MRSNKKFGLVFEDHLPENTALYGVGISVGSLVVRRDDLHQTMRVVAIEGDKNIF